ncbi:T9SS type A sorting domain-containing protein [Kaistella jeonii]|uniref:T9SS type A sorting domain-containing protein n=1 Tax=Kaistella jeonii TaxID=266749 RepID=UPI00068A1911|nr:T9SS type A sorting domain-containing protein [Kaistella jeonii]SFB85985.1 Por secretion system C-terminal sorting domain-containing protein [Kaistella jeonii]VEI96037.1 Internalin-J precursor [Kaistella jeonii]
MKRTLLLFNLLFATFSIVNAQNIYIPDVNFKAFLVGSSQINTNGDNEIQITEAEAFSFGMDCSGKNINDLTGIEAFVNLRLLKCFYNNLVSVDVTKNTALLELWCNNNQLSSLDVSKNIFLLELHATSNNINSLDISKNIALEFLSCGENSLSNLDVTKNTMLQFLYCNKNQITTLDVSKNSMLQILWCYENQLSALNAKNGNNTTLSVFRTYDNPQLTCIQVDDAIYANSQIGFLWWKDDWANYSTDCNYMGVRNFTKKEITLFPNPTNDVLHFSEQVSDIKISDFSGKEIMQLSGSVKYINLLNLAKGTYIISATMKSGKTISEKFLKE